jgi:glutamyl-tRNA reductase
METGEARYLTAETRKAMEIAERETENAEELDEKVNRLNIG